MEQVMNLTFASSLTDLCELNSSFDKGVLKIAYVGDNRNRSSISKQAFLNCIKTMYNCPVVCNYDRESDTLGGHDMSVVRGANGELRVINATSPVGMIPESAKVWFEDVEEEDGTIHEYLFTEALLWKRQEAYRKIRRDGITAQSMEITVRDSEMADGILNIKDFEFTAFCLIGCEPCYEGASLQMSLATDFKQQLSEMMQELKESFTLVNPSEETTKEVNDICHRQNYSTEGGEKVLHEKTELAAKYGIDIESLDFNLEDFSLEELTEKFEALQKAEFTAEDAADENAPEAAPENAPEEERIEEAAQEVEPEKEFALTSNVTEEIVRSLKMATVEREWGECPRYLYVDCDLEAQEVYCWDTEDWLLYGFSYSMNGDNAVIDFESKTRKKYVIADFDEGEQDSPMAQVFAQMEEKLRAFALKEAEYQKASDTIASMETELGELRQFKADTENAALQSAREEVFARFEDLIGVEAFEALRENQEQYSDVNALEEKCYAIRGRAGTVAKFSHEEKSPKIKVVMDYDNTKEPYGGIFAHFGIEAE